jgi:hypothetical protein
MNQIVLQLVDQAVKLGFFFLYLPFYCEIEIVTINQKATLMEQGNDSTLKD